MTKTALITGASRGIGAAAAEALAADGWDVVINYLHSEKAAQTLAGRLGARTVRADISDEQQVDRMFDTVGDVSLLVCCAGIAHSGLVTDMTAEEWRRLFAVNIDGVFYCCRRAIPSMVRAQKGGIITVSSMWGLTGASCEAAYSATKAAVIGYTKALAKELGPSNIRVNCVAPGVVDTDMNAALTPEDIAALCEETPLGRTAQASEIADVIAFLASEKAGFITGQVISANGGFVI